MSLKPVIVIQVFQFPFSQVMYQTIIPSLISAWITNSGDMRTWLSSMETGRGRTPSGIGLPVFVLADTVEDVW